MNRNTINLYFSAFFVSTYNLPNVALYVTSYTEYFFNFISVNLDQFRLYSDMIEETARAVS